MSKMRNTAYEQQVVLHYLDNLLKSSLSKDLQNRVFDWFEENSQFLIGQDVGDQWEPAHHFRREASDSSLLPRNLTTLKNWITPYAKVPLESKMADTLIKTFDLPESERPIILFYALQCEFAELARFYNDVTHYDNAEIAARMIRIPLKQYENHFSGHSPLTRTGLFGGGDRRSGYGPSRLFNDLVLAGVHSPKDVHNFLLGKPVAAKLKPASFQYLAEEYDTIRDLLCGAVNHQAHGVNILIYGAPGTGKTEMVKTLCRDAGITLYEVSQCNRERTGAERRFDLRASLALLKNGERVALMLDEAEDVFRDSRSSQDQSKLFFNRLLETNTIPVIWISNSIQGVDPAHMRRFLRAIKMPYPDTQARMAIWRKCARKHHVKLTSQEVQCLANTYDITPSLIDSSLFAAKITEKHSMIEKTIDSQIQSLDLPRPRRRDEYMDALSDRVKKHRKNSESQGGLNTFSPELLNCSVDLENLAKRIVQGNVRSFNICLYGVPGSGKTAYAQFLADQMKIPLLKKRASDLMDQYVGMSEKNIASMFKEAKDKGALLVLDEADTFLRSRERSERRWEVSQVNEMLTHMEMYTCPFVCTTNLMTDIDEASLRRFTFKVCYDYLKPQQVEIAYRHFFGKPAELPLSDFTHLTPGDFATVARKASILGIADSAELVEMLSQEQAHKKDYKPKSHFGFVV